MKVKKAKRLTLVHLMPGTKEPNMTVTTKAPSARDAVESFLDDLARDLAARSLPTRQMAKDRRWCEHYDYLFSQVREQLGKLMSGQSVEATLRTVYALDLDDDGNERCEAMLEMLGMM